ncbi:hypothetical protein HanRHA438_Chr03g0123701 [Helianthus annuus]|nr:hypothetical protein HanHA300_Chr03g0093131 [Helianthus annuus]KAJ0600873.1 hypothetical protein HanIR_Chr03g0122001 [Helianthus annuus]KAJ0608102.1 hypothetical protein HanHA89_Chr03g0104831 [Helianthus annuus]KAJ0768168.1 hypothetical protein HanLR1_Chr03g0098211 [Helianthus annuus]KAJ0773940.1 hypothetical protein HanOQP8_Chr03g0105981 [Helianthus annuus]
MMVVERYGERKEIMEREVLCIIIYRVNYKFCPFMFVLNCRQCPLPLNLTSFVLNVSKSYTLCPLALTQSDFFVKYGHVTCT